MNEIGYYLSYILSEDNTWELAPCFYPKRPIPNIPKPDIANLEYKEGDIVYAVAKGMERSCKVDHIFIFYNFDKVDKNWEIYYDLKWVGTGHTHGFFQSKDIIKK